jgi:hypothetical protein
MGFRRRRTAGALDRDRAPSERGPEERRHSEQASDPFAVKLRSRDPDLVHWPRWSKRVLAPDWYEALNRAGGGKAPTWYLYFGVIAPGLIEPIDVATATPLDGWPEAFVSLPVAPEGG